MTIDKSAFLSVGLPWLVTIVVAAAIVFFGKRDLIDITVLLVLVLLSGNRTRMYLRSRKKESGER